MPLTDSFQQKLQLSWWKELIKDYFAPKAIMKFTLWKDNSRQEAKPFGKRYTTILPIRQETEVGPNIRRNWYCNSSSVFSRYGTIWRQIYVPFTRWRTRTAIHNGSFNNRVCYGGMDVQVYQWVYCDATRTPHGARHHLSTNPTEHRLTWIKWWRRKPTFRAAAV